MEKSYYYFAYGSNLNTARMFERCETAQLVTTATIENYYLTFQKNPSGRAVANLLPKEGETAVGSIYKMTAADIAALDRYEGHPRVYKREWVEVKFKSGRMVKAVTYLMVDGDKRPFGSPAKDYFNHLHKGFTQWGLPKIKLQKAVEGVIKVDKRETFNVFVYGTLREGFGNHERYLSDAPKLGEATLCGKYEMYHLGGFPAIVDGEQNDVMLGEVYEVTEGELARLDMLEGYNPRNPRNSMYDRRMVEVEHESGKVMEAFVYIMARTSALVRNSIRVESGDWAEFMAEHAPTRRTGSVEAMLAKYDEDDDSDLDERLGDDEFGEMICPDCGELNRSCICDK